MKKQKDERPHALRVVETIYLGHQTAQELADDLKRMIKTHGKDVVMKLDRQDPQHISLNFSTMQPVYTYEENLEMVRESVLKAFGGVTLTKKP